MNGGTRQSDLLWDRIRGHTMDLVRLAFPIIIARVGWMTMQLVDTAMVGRYDTNELAFQSMAGTVVGILFVPTMGLMLGALITTANAYGEERYVECGAVWRRAMPYAAILGLGLAVFCMFGEEILLALKIEAGIARGAGRVTEIYGYGMPLGIAYIASMYFLEGIKRPIPGVLLMVTANMLNVCLNWVLVYGNLGFPAMGAEGSAWATTILRVFLTAGIVFYIWFMPGAERYGVRLKPSGGWKAWAEQRRLGYAAGLSFGIEHSAFMALFIFAGWLGTLAVASMNIVFGVFGFFFMAAAGISSATGVLVGNAWGRRDMGDVAFSGWTGLAFNGVVLAPAAALLLVVPATIGSLFTDDPAVIAAAVPLYILGGYALILDGAQTVLANALRARHDKWFPTGSHTVSYVFLMAPFAWYLAFAAGHGARGLMESFVVASIVSIVFLIARFAWLSSRDRRVLAMSPSGETAVMEAAEAQEPAAPPIGAPSSSIH